jgi:hypothetical protein
MWAIIVYIYFFLKKREKRKKNSEYFEKKIIQLVRRDARDSFSIDFNSSCRRNDFFETK